MLLAAGYCRLVDENKPVVSENSCCGFMVLGDLTSHTCLKFWCCYNFQSSVIIT